MSDAQTMEPRAILSRATEDAINARPLIGALDFDAFWAEVAEAQLAALEAAGYVVVKADRRDWQRDAEHHRCPVCGVEFDNEWWGLPMQDGSAAE